MKDIHCETLQYVMLLSLVHVYTVLKYVVSTGTKLKAFQCLSECTCVLPLHQLDTCKVGNLGGCCPFYICFVCKIGLSSLQFFFSVCLPLPPSDSVKSFVWPHHIQDHFYYCHQLGRNESSQCELWLSVFIVVRR